MNFIATLVWRHWMHSVVMLSGAIKSNMLIVVIPNVIIPNVIMLNVVAPSTEKSLNLNGTSAPIFFIKSMQKLRNVS